MDAYLRHRSSLAQVLDPRCYTLEWVDSEIAEGRISVRATEDAIILTQVRTFPTGAREIHGMAAAGELPSILALIQQAEQWARSQGIEFATVASRPGWQRVLAPYGYQVHQVELQKEL